MNKPPPQSTDFYRLTGVRSDGHTVTVLDRMTLKEAEHAARVVREAGIFEDVQIVRDDSTRHPSARN